MLLNLMRVHWWLYLATALFVKSRASTPLDYVESHMQKFKQDLIELASIPTVSALPEHLPDIARAASWLETRLKSAGLENIRTIATEGPRPVVYADWLHAPGRPTVLIYGHYDVQPVDPLELWITPPFEPVIKDGYFYGRGVDDDKGGLLLPVHAIESFLNTEKKIPVNVKLLLEGEEEIGSPFLERFLEAHKDVFAADFALSADGGQPSSTQGGISLGLRGNVAIEINVTTASTDMHSGFYGGSVPNAVHVLVQLLGSFRDPQGAIAVEGYYDAVRPMSAADKADAAAFEDVEDWAGERESLGVTAYSGEPGYSTVERRWHRPTIEVVGMSGGFTGAGIKTIVPAQASAKLACRLVPHQQPRDIVEKIQRHVQQHTPPGANVSVTSTSFLAPAWDSPRHSFGNRAADKVLTQEFGKPPTYRRDGATIPALAFFQHVLGIDTTVFAFGLGEFIHAPNERLMVSMYERGHRSWVNLLSELGAAAWPPLQDSDTVAQPAAKDGGSSRDEL